MRVGSHPMAGNVGHDARWMHASYIGLHPLILVAAIGLTSAKTIPFLAAEEIANYLFLEPGTTQDPKAVCRARRQATII